MVSSGIQEHAIAWKKLTGAFTVRPARLLSGSSSKKPGCASNPGAFKDEQAFILDDILKERQAEGRL